MALLATGGGKSAIYQLAGVERPGATLVVSPLLALQQDQLESLRELGLPARALNSTLSEGAREEALGTIESGEAEFLLLAPEQLANDDVLERLIALRPSLFVVDEAHCVSEWGHDFRPEYRRLGRARDLLGHPPTLALTGTASPAVRDDIVRWLRLDDPLIVARGFDRPELFLSVERFPDTARKRESLLGWVVEAERPGIVYCATRRATEEIATELGTRGIRAAAYHAGLGSRQRATVLDQFMDDAIEVVVATVAFGMGVDKRNVRFVAHHDPSDSLDAYHQEIGRAARDGEPGQARLFFDPADLGLRRFQTVPAPFEEADAARLLRRLRGSGGEPAALAHELRMSRSRVEQIGGRLEDLGLVEIGTAGEMSLTDDGLTGSVPVHATEAVEEQERRRRHARSRIELLRGYAETTGCRRRFLLNALGEEFEPPCDRCDNDLAVAESRADARAGMESAGEHDPEHGRAEREPSLVDDLDGPFSLGDRVVHARFGEGEVARVEGDRVVVRFESVGYRTLALDAVMEQGLLRSGTG